MTAALKDEPATPFRVPSGVRLVRVDAETGRLAGPGMDAAILEAYTWPRADRNQHGAAHRAAGERQAPAPGALPQRGCRRPEVLLGRWPPGRLLGGARRAIATRPDLPTADGDE